MSKDGQFTYLHLHASHHADFLEEYNRTPLHPDEIFIHPHLQPPNPEDEDDLVPEQHAAFGITRATQKTPQPVWRDLGLEALMHPKQGNTDNIEIRLKQLLLR